MPLVLSEARRNEVMFETWARASLCLKHYRGLLLDVPCAGATLLMLGSGTHLRGFPQHNV